MRRPAGAVEVEMKGESSRHSSTSPRRVPSRVSRLLARLCGVAAQRARRVRVFRVTATSTPPHACFPLPPACLRWTQISVLKQSAVMALPPPLRASVTPAELELIACEQLVEIIPLVAMERTAFISV